MEAIVAAARWGGEIMMKPGELGIVKEGALADLLLVDGNSVAGIGIPAGSRLPPGDHEVG
jgi:imidazolonepropionase-like amidohydrolase